MLAEPVLAVKGLSCGYPRRQVIHDVSFEVIRGEVVALLGPNGSGKSTLLKTITGSPSPSPGSITIAGCVLESLGIAERARRIGFVPQEEHSVFGFSARQVVLMGRMAHSGGLFESIQDLSVAENAMRAADCWELADRAVTELSGGEAQRVLIARALAQEPELLLLDEPSSHLDVSHQEATARLLRDRAQHGMGVLVAVHDLNYAARIADRAILLHDGRVKLIDSIEGVLQSSTLDDVYQVQFQRIAGPTGECLLVPSVTS